ncbi:TF2AY factor, partial [Crotophaga sulcirostris]|nr:TF2AY factor [Crotophaga sulcirostris]
KLYKSIIEDVIEGVRQLFVEEGVEEQVLKDLKKLWETKVMQSKATEGFFRRSHHCSLMTLQMPHSFHRVLQTSAGQMQAPGACDFLLMLLCMQGASRAGASLALTSGIAYPVHVPVGVTLQMASGRLYKVNVPVMVTQTPRGASVLHHAAQQIFQPSVLQGSVASTAHVHSCSANASAVPAAVETLKPQDTAAQQNVVLQPNVMEKAHLESSANTTLVQQPSASQQQLAANAALNPPAHSTENSQDSSLCAFVFPREPSEGFSPVESLANKSNDVLLDVEGPLDIESLGSVPKQVSDDIIDLIISGRSLDDANVLKGEDSTSFSDKMEPTEQMESNLQLRKNISGNVEDIIQLDGTGDASPKEEILRPDDREKNEFIGIIESEDLSVLQDEDEDDEECDSISNTESSGGGGGGDNEEFQIDVVEEDPLNSGDDVSEQDVADLFDTDNVIVCQFDKIHRSKNKWKFYLKDGVMSLEGKDHVFAKAVGDAEW